MSDVPKKILENVRVFIISRLDIGGDGSRNGLVQAAYRLARAEEPHGETEPSNFGVIAGGLVDYRALLDHLREQTEEAWLKIKNLPPGVRMKKPELVAEETERFLEKWIKRISGIIPQYKRQDGEFFKTYIVTSPYYDGWIGRRIAEELSRRREDILYWGESSAVFPIKGFGKTLLVLVPSKAPWRGEYFSRPAQNADKDYHRASVHDVADLVVVGCGGSFIHKPAGGESPRTVMSVPSLSNILGVKTSENQVGVLIAEFRPDNPIPTGRVYSYKDALMRERENIRFPQNIPSYALDVVHALQERREGMTEGLLAEATALDRKKIHKGIKWLLKRRASQFKFDGESRKIDFRPKYLQTEVSYQLVPRGHEVKEDCGLGWACLHAGYAAQARSFFCNRVPELIVRFGVDTIHGAGDFIAGLAHDLDRKGALVGGLANYTRQEKHAAAEVAGVLIKSLRVRLDQYFTGIADVSRLTTEEVAAVLLQLLSDAFYIPGNHDDWVTRDGHEALAKFDDELRRRLRVFLYHELVSRGVGTIPDLDAIINRKVRRSGVPQNVDGLGPTYVGRMEHTRSGATLQHLHPSMGRAQTWSIRPQQCLGFSNAQVVWEGNFHVGIVVLQWEPKAGQRVVVQAGTIVLGTAFEDSKLKEVDTHVVILRTRTANGRIIMTESSFIAPTEDEKTVYDTASVLDEQELALGIALPGAA